MGRRLAAAVHVRHPKTNDWLILQPGDEPDEDLAEAITNPDAWEDSAQDSDDADQDPDADGTEPEPDPEPKPEEPEPEPMAEPGPVKPVRSRTRKATDEQ